MDTTRFDTEREVLDRAAKDEWLAKAEAALRETRTELARVVLSDLIDKALPPVVDVQRQSDALTELTNAGYRATAIADGMSSVVDALIQWRARRARRRQRRQTFSIGALVTVISLALLIFAFFISPLSSQGSITQKLDRGQLVVPVGESAYDLWKKLQSEAPKSDVLTESSSKALPLLQERGEQIFRRWHDDAQGTDEEWLEVSRIYEWATQLNPNDKRLRARQSYSIGQVAFRQQRFDEALRAYSQTLQDEKCMALAYNGIGRIHAKNRDYANAEKYYNNAIQCEPRWCYPLANLGGVYLQMSKYQQAESAYQKAIACAPNNASFHYQLALLYDNRKRSCDALSAYQKVLGFMRSGTEPELTRAQVQQRIDKLRGQCRR